MAKKKKMKMDWLNLLLVSVASGGLLFGQGWILSMLQGVLSSWFDVIHGIFGVVWFSLGEMLRKGKETFLETLKYVAIIGIVFQLLGKLPFNIPYLTWAVEWSLSGILITFGTVWLAQALIQRFR